MERKLIVSVKLLTDEQKNRIERSAKEAGFVPYLIEEEEKALAAAADAEIIFSSFPDLAGASSNLKWYCTPYAGVDDLDPGYFRATGAVLTNSSGAYGVTISEHAVMTTLEVLRNRQAYADHVAKREWIRKLPTRSIHGSRILLWGTGDIGQEIAARFKSFRPASIKGVNRSGKKPCALFETVVSSDQIENLLPDTDILVMSLPGTKETVHVLDAARLSLLPDQAVIVNVGRGSCIDEKALEKELRTGRLFAALDVFETEPLPDHSALWDCPNLLITPHVAGDLTLPYTKERAVQMFLENLKRYTRGEELLHTVDLAKGY